MNLFVDYIQPLTDWLQINPHWALFITFLMSLLESLAIIGSIVPGSVTMTAVGILAGSGVMRVDLTLLAAILGAIAGDSLSYALGYFYSDELTNRWPFKKYPLWLKYGKDFFERHGGKSVLLGRFIGPLRSIMPLIAGIMHMQQWRFLVANLISAIGWSILFVMPGVLIGAASHELSPESATRLFLLILLVLASIWLLSLLIKWALTNLRWYLRKHLHEYWFTLKNHPLLFRIFNAITPANEKNHEETATLLLMAFFSAACFVGLSLLYLSDSWFAALNNPVHLFFQSFRTGLLESFFIVCTQLTSLTTLASLVAAAILWFFYTKNTKGAIYLISILSTSGLIAFFLAYWVNTPRPQGLLITMPGSSFPALPLVIATAFYGFLVHASKTKHPIINSSFKSFILIVLGLSGLGGVFLGDYWLTDVLSAYCLGACIGLIHCLAYRRLTTSEVTSTPFPLMIYSLITILLCATGISSAKHFKLLLHNHTPFYKEFILEESQWWNQQSPILPLYRLNRIGKRMSLLNIQYSGQLDLLEEHLTEKGWVQHEEPFFSNLLARMNTKSTGVQLPLLAQLYENKSPQLLMTFSDKESSLILDLRIWESNYYLSGVEGPLWIGSVHAHDALNKTKIKDTLSLSNKGNALSYLLPALSGFSLRQVPLQSNKLKTVAMPAAPMILLIKNHSARGFEEDTMEIYTGP